MRVNANKVREVKKRIQQTQKCLVEITAAQLRSVEFGSIQIKNLLLNDDAEEVIGTPFKSSHLLPPNIVSV